jgi:hypothetical protein
MITYRQMFRELERPMAQFQRIAHRMDIPASAAGDLFHGGWYCPAISTPVVETQPNRPSMREVYSRAYLAKLRGKTAHPKG